MPLDIKKAIRDAQMKGSCSGKCNGKCDGKDSKGASCTGTCDGKCEGDENCGLCPQDCGQPCICGNFTCQAQCGENAPRVGSQRGQRQHHHHVEDAVRGWRADVQVAQQDAQPRRQYRDYAPQARSGEFVHAEQDDAEAVSHDHHVEPT